MYVNNKLTLHVGICELQSSLFYTYIISVTNTHTKLRNELCTAKHHSSNTYVYYSFIWKLTVIQNTEVFGSG